jgi:hypothetical protein
MAVLANAVTDTLSLCIFFYFVELYQLMQHKHSPRNAPDLYHIRFRGSIFNRLDRNVKAPERNADRNVRTMYYKRRTTVQYIEHNYLYCI